MFVCQVYIIHMAVLLISMYAELNINMYANFILLVLWEYISFQGINMGAEDGIGLGKIF